MRCWERATATAAILAATEASAADQDDIDDGLAAGATVYADLSAGDTLVCSGATYGITRPDGTTTTCVSTLLAAKTGTYTIGVAVSAWPWTLDVYDRSLNRQSERVFSDAWKLHPEKLSTGPGATGVLYAPVSVDGTDRMIAIQVGGYAPSGTAAYELLATTAGAPDAGGRSIRGTRSLDGELPLFLDPPDAGYTTSIPDERAGALSATFAYDDPSCPILTPSTETGSILVPDDDEGVWHLVCDRDADGVFDVSAATDVHLLGAWADLGGALAWDGADWDSSAASGRFECVVWHTRGELHLLSSAIEQADPGIRMFDYTADATAGYGVAGVPLPMFWNDAEVVASGATAVTSGPDGFSGAGTALSRGVTSRGWSSADRRGAGAVVDTWTFLARDVSDPFDVHVVDPAEDGDGDGVLSYDELCGVPVDLDDDGIENDLDTDDDGDGIASIVEGSADLDGDGLASWRDDDDDGDGVPTATEAAGDTDADGWADWSDADDDGDSIPTIDEIGEHDTDGDGVENWLDGDDDGDGFATIDEAYRDDPDGDGAPDWVDEDSDGDGVPDGSDSAALLSSSAADPRSDWDADGIPDFRDADDDGDGLDTAIEAPFGDWDGDGVDDRWDRDSDDDLILDVEEGTWDAGDRWAADLDDDGVPDWHDDDDDGDGRPTADEDVDGDGIPGDDDSDADGTADALDADDDGDGHRSAAEGWSDPDGDGVASALDDDADGDHVPDVLEGLLGEDADHDSVGDVLDTDDDGDGVPTRHEDALSPGDPTGTDSDADGRPDWLDADDDGDGLWTAFEAIDDPDTDEDAAPDRLDGDSDADGIPDRSEGFVDEDRDGRWGPSEPLLETDGDSTPDFRDTDDDGDGVPTAADFGPGEVLGSDWDGDWIPDYRDADDDGDGLPSAVEDGWDDADGDGVPSRYDGDSDGDLVPDGREQREGAAFDTDGDGVADPAETDDDDDGMPTATEDVDSNGDPTNDDTDADGVADYRDSDSDGDGLSDRDEGTTDTDGDGTPDARDADDDGDGIPTATERAAEDPDGDGAPSWHDTDSDGDGLADRDEGTADRDRDGVPDYLDPLDFYGGNRCGCATGGPAWGPWALVLLASRRRRRPPT